MRIIQSTLIYSILVLSILTSCAPTQKTMKVEKRTMELLSLSATDSSQVELISWRDFFTDKALIGYIDIALKENFDLRSAIKNVELAEQEFQQARMGWLPELSLSPSTSYTRNTDIERKQGLASTTQSYAVPLQFVWEIDVWGKIKKEKQAIHSEFLRTKEARRAVISSIISSVANTYYDLLLLNKQQQIINRSIVLSDSTLNMLKVQFKLGDITQPVLSQAEAEYHSLLLTLLQTEKLQEQTAHTLALLTGQSTLGQWVTQTDFPETKGTFEMQTDISASLLQNRPDIKAAEWALHAANACVGIARRNFYPSLTLQAQGGGRNSSATSLFPIDKALFGLIEGAIYQPIFTRGRLKKEYAQARIRKEQSEIEFQKSFTTACIEVVDALSEVESLRKQLVEAKKRSYNLENTLRDNRLLFRSGKVIYLEVLTMQRDLLQAEIEEAAIICQQRKAGIALYRALGGGSGEH